MQNATTIVKYRRLAAWYDRLFENPVVRRARARAFALVPALPPGARVLLVGVGTGAERPFLPSGCRATGVDLTEAMLRRARQRPGPLSLARMDAERLGFADGAFDLVVLSLLLSVVEQPALAFAEAVRVTRPGGALLVFDKFVPEGVTAGRGRTLLNRLTVALGTDITRRLGDAIGRQAVQVVREDRRLLGGQYRAVLLQRSLVVPGGWEESSGQALSLTGWGSRS